MMLFLDYGNLIKTFPQHHNQARAPTVQRPSTGSAPWPWQPQDVARLTRVSHAWQGLRSHFWIFFGEMQNDNQVEVVQLL